VWHCGRDVEAVKFCVSGNKLEAEANSEATNFIRSWKQKIFYCFHIPGLPSADKRERFDFLKFIVCPHGQGEGSIFRDFVQTSFMDGSLPLSYSHYSMLHYFKLAWP